MAVDARYALAGGALRSWLRAARLQSYFTALVHGAGGVVAALAGGPQT